MCPMPAIRSLIERVLGSSTMRGIPLTTERKGVALLPAPGRAASAACC